MNHVILNHYGAPGLRVSIGWLKRQERFWAAVQKFFDTNSFPSLPFPSLPFPSLPFPSLPFPSLPFPSLPFPSLPQPLAGEGISIYVGLLTLFTQIPLFTKHGYAPRFEGLLRA